MSQMTQPSCRSPGPPPEPVREPQQKRRRWDKRPEPNILSLPDEPISLILSLLGASKTGGTFRAPRHAFALAQTNTRFLHLFSAMLTHINPDLSNTTPATLSSTHLLAVARLAGPALREISLPHGSFQMLSQLSKLCPRLEALALFQEKDAVVCGLADMRDLSLRILHLNDPTKETLRLLDAPPPELALTEVPADCVEELIRILQYPLRKLCLHFKPKYHDPSSLLGLFQCLGDLCPKLDTLSLAVYTDPQEPTAQFVYDASRLIAAVRSNDNESLCRRVMLEGTQAFGLLGMVHPEAKIEITHGDVSFSDEGDGVFARSLRLLDLMPTVDVSRLQNVRIHPICDPTRREILSGVKLEHAIVQDLRVVANLSLTVHTVEVSASGLRGLREWAWEWDWLSKVREVHFHAPLCRKRKGCMGLFCKLLASLLDSFHGDVVWVEHFKAPCAFDDASDIRNLISAGRALFDAVASFEERGGDAGTVRVLVDDVLADHV